MLSARARPNDVIRAMRRSRCTARRSLRSPEWEVHREGRPVGPRRRAGERAPEFAGDDVARDGEPEPRPLAGRLGGEELVEDALAGIRADARAEVVDAEQDLALLGCGRLDDDPLACERQAL